MKFAEVLKNAYFAEDLQTTASTNLLNESSETGIFPGNLKIADITLHYVKSVQIRSFFWSVFSCIQSEYRKIRTRKNSVFGHFSTDYIKII